MPQANPLAALVVLAVLGSIVVTWLAVLLRFAFELPVLPPRTPRVVPWGAGSVLGAILLWFAMQNAAAVVYFVAAKRPRADAAAAGKASLSPLEMMGLSAAGNLATVIVIPLVLAVTCGARRRDFGLEGPGMARQVFRGIVAYPLLAPCVFGLMLIAVAIWGKSPHPLEDAMLKDHTPGTVALLAFAGVAMAPLSEELIFRGVLLGWLTRLALGARGQSKPAIEPGWIDDASENFPSAGADAHGSFLEPIAAEAIDGDEENSDRPPGAGVTANGPSEEIDTHHPARLLLANMAVSTVFAALHGAQWPAPVPLFVLSLGLGVLYQRTGSLLPPIALHMTFNGVSTLLMFLTVGTAHPDDPRAPNPIPGPAAHQFLDAHIETGQGVDWGKFKVMIQADPIEKGA